MYFAVCMGDSPGRLMPTEILLAGEVEFIFQTNEFGNDIWLDTNLAY